MASNHRRVVLAGERCGDLVPVRQHWVFFTTHQKLKALHGKTYATPEDSYRDIAAALRAPMRRAA